MRVTSVLLAWVKVQSDLPKVLAACCCNYYYICNVAHLRQQQQQQQHPSHSCRFISKSSQVKVKLKVLAVCCCIYCHILNATNLGRERCDNPQRIGMLVMGRGMSCCGILLHKAMTMRSQGAPYAVLLAPAALHSQT